MQKVLITGANGFVGYYLTKQLLQNHFDVVATGKGPNRLSFSEAHFCYESLDFTDAESVELVMQKHKTGVIVHLGALSKPDECELNKAAAYKVNVTGTLNLLEAAKKEKAFFILLSTDFVFDGEKGMYREEDDRKAVNYYGETKIIGEDEVMKYPFDWAIARTVLVYGKPNDSRQNIVTNVAGALKEGRELKIFSDQSRTPTYVEDLAKGLLSIIEKKATGIYHLSGEDKLSPYDIAVSVANYLGYDKSNIQEVAEKDFDQPARRPPKTGFNLTKAKKLLNYQPISFAEGLKNTLS